MINKNKTKLNNYNKNNMKRLYYIKNNNQTKEKNY